MTITANTGLPGSGKSYTAVANVILPALKSGRTVVTNIPMTECVQELPGTLIQFSNDEFKEDVAFLSKQPKGSVFVIDEVWRFWPAGLVANKIPEEHKAFFAEHRHLVDEQGNTTEITLVTQDLQHIASFFRSLTETTYKTTKLQKIGASNSYRVDVYSGAQSGPNIPTSRIENQLYGKYSKDVYRFYKSHTKADAGSVGNEERTDKRFRLFSKKKLALMLTVFAVVGFGVFKAYERVLSSYGASDDVVIEQSVSKPQSTKKDALSDGSSGYIFDSLTHISYEIFTMTKGVVKLEIGFELNHKERLVYLNNELLAEYGIKIKRLTDCLYMLTLDNRSKFLSCPKKEEPKEDQGFLGEIVNM